MTTDKPKTQYSRTSRSDAWDDDFNMLSVRAAGAKIGMTGMGISVALKKIFNKLALAVIEGTDPDWNPKSPDAKRRIREVGASPEFQALVARLLKEKTQMRTSPFSTGSQDDSGDSQDEEPGVTIHHLAGSNGGQRE
jgi:hypothetical protein